MKQQNKNKNKNLLEQNRRRGEEDHEDDENHVDENAAKPPEWADLRYVLPFDVVGRRRVLDVPGVGTELFAQYRIFGQLVAQIAVGQRRIVAASVLEQLAEEAESIVAQECVRHLLLFERDKEDVERTREHALAALANAHLQIALALCVELDRVGQIFAVGLKTPAETGAAQLDEAAKMIRIHERTRARLSVYDLARHFANMHATPFVNK